MYLLTFFRTLVCLMNDILAFLTLLAEMSGTRWHNLVLCWVDIDQKTGRVQDFSDLGKCSRQQGLDQSLVETKLIHWRTRMPREKIFGLENHPDRSKNIMVSPEKVLF